jgi:serine/threonine-protein kinase RsbW
MTARLSIQLANQLSEIGRLADIVERFGADSGLPEETVFQINLALDEIVANVIRHAHGDNGHHEIVVRLEAHHDGVVAEVEDDGVAFNPLEAPPPDVDVPVEQRRIGGLGIHIVRTMMDSVQYRREGERNLLVVHKRNSPARP